MLVLIVKVIHYCYLVPINTPFSFCFFYSLFDSFLLPFFNLLEGLYDHLSFFSFPFFCKCSTVIVSLLSIVECTIHLYIHTACLTVCLPSSSSSNASSALFHLHYWDHSSSSSSSPVDHLASVCLLLFIQWTVAITRDYIGLCDSLMLSLPFSFSSSIAVSLSFFPSLLLCAL